ncbi:Protein of unknown function [Pyronema omphalodes CBS 100304]|uniref:Uncharacterized protein n=1 Tax=Pyronema omphalodes (strain CBS 100304) TaxID=1076935 RepID=U4KWR9_PYROM|nr:Protein of unknown function [Pyronema omphalodes CBS 100304]
MMPYPASMTHQISVNDSVAAV